jgi:hypothetical protein
MTVTFATRPLSRTKISSGSQVATRVVDFDARAGLGAGGRPVDFMVTSSGYFSREAGQSPPALILQLRASTPPAIAIALPATPVAVDPGTPVHLQATASDAENGDLSARIIWTSDLTGRLGSGAALDVVLPPGEHRVTAAVTDGAFLTRSASVGVRVVCPQPCDDGDRCTEDTCGADGCLHVELPATTPAQVLCGVENLLAGRPAVLPPLQRHVRRLQAALAATERVAGTRSCLRRARAAARAARGLDRAVARLVARPAGLPAGGDVAGESHRLRLRAEAMADAFCR